jgi:hypothetical protein
MKKRIRIIVAMATLALLLAGMSSSVTQADSDQAGYVYLIGTSDAVVPLCSLGPSACPDVAMASNGQTIDFYGMGTLSIHSKSVTGGGHYTHHFGADSSVSGTWTAENLLSFVGYGCEDRGFPALVCGGQALIQVHIVAEGGLFEGDGVLQVDAPFGTPPSGTGAGIRLAVPGALNFNKEVSGLAAFYPLP